MNIFLTSISSIIPIVVIIILGYVLQVRGWFAGDFGDNLSKLIMNVALPASIFVSVLKYLTLDKLVSLSGGLLYTFGAFILTYIVAYIVVKVFKVPAGRRGTVINTFVNANTIFIGLPLNVALFGDNALPYFLIYYITNTISTWTLGVYIMTSDSESGKSEVAAKFDWKRLLPAPLVGFLVALVFLVLRIPVPSFATSTLTFALLYLVGKGLPSDEVKTFIVQSAAPALAVLPILASQGDGDVEFATNVVTISTVLFVVVIPVVVTLLG